MVCTLRPPLTRSDRKQGTVSGERGRSVGRGPAAHPSSPGIRRTGVVARHPTAPDRLASVEHFPAACAMQRAAREADTRGRTRREQTTPSPTTRVQRRRVGAGRLPGGDAARVAATEPDPATGGHARSQRRLQHWRVQPLGRGHVVTGTAHFNYWSLAKNTV